MQALMPVFRNVSLATWLIGQAIGHVAGSVKFRMACADVQDTAQRAAALAHADLATAVVMEMTALAGTMGRHYAQQDGFLGQSVKPSMRWCCQEMLETLSQALRQVQEYSH